MKRNKVALRHFAFIDAVTTLRSSFYNNGYRNKYRNFTYTLYNKIDKFSVIIQNNMVNFDIQVQF